MSVGSTSDAAGAGGGLAALMVAANPALTPEQMKAAMIAGVDTIAGMEGQLVSNVRHIPPYLQAPLAMQSAAMTLHALMPVSVGCQAWSSQP